MDANALVRPRIADREALQDFADALKDHAQTIERDVGRLKRSAQDDPEKVDLAGIADLFRAVHNIKGDAALCRFEAGVLLTHPLETLLARVRAGELALSDLLAEVILLAIDRLELATDAVLTGQSLDGLRLPVLHRSLESLSGQQKASLDLACADAIEAVTGFRPAQARPATVFKPIAATRVTGEAQTDADLTFFRQLAEQLDARAQSLHGRTARLLKLARDTNELMGKPIDPTQLEAAVLMHDVGMMFLPDPTWLKPGKLSDHERKDLRKHPAWAAGFLERMHGWDEAARIVRQHHEMPDGRGYPNSLSSSDICAGAKLLAIIDAFESVMQKQAHRGKSRSVLRAIAEVNANPNQFAPEWIDPFNRVVRQILEA